MTSIPLPAIDPSAFKIAAQAGAMRAAAMPIHLRNLDSRAYRRIKSKSCSTQGPIAQAASAQKMFLTRSATDVLQGLPACRQHYPHSGKTSAPSFGFNEVALAIASRAPACPRPHRTLQIPKSAIE
jgi:hypothetical protein